MFDRSRIRTLIVAMGISAISLAARAQFNGIYTFDSTWDGFSPNYADYLAQGVDGSLHGTMPQGISQAFYGSWFDYPIGGTVQIHGLTSSTQPEQPWAGLTLGIDGNLYGATIHGGGARTGGSTYGTVFEISNGQMSTIVKFTGGENGSANGGFPYAPPIQAPDGNLYGVTYDGDYVGYVYQIVMTNGVGTRGWTQPLPAGTKAALVMASDGNLYGTTAYGGVPINGVSPNNNNGGCLFQVTLGGVITGIFNFDNSSAGNSGATDGVRPYGGVIQGWDGYLYGATTEGGAYSGGTVYKVALNGTHFSAIHHFQYNDGTAPSGGLMQGSDGSIYGLTSANGYILNFPIRGGGLAFTTEGTVFKMDTTGGNFTRLFTFYKSNFNGQGSGNNPISTPLLHTSGVIYGLTASGGSGTTGSCHGCYDNGGEFFSYGTGMAPFASVVNQRNAKVGDTISIIGQGFYGWTGVTFGGTPANGKFAIHVISDNFMTVVVPAGAQTGKIVVQEINGVNLSTPYNFTIDCSGIFCLKHI